MAIVPDTKNWTWVLDEVCPECGYDAAGVDVHQMGALVRANAAAWPDVLAAPDAGVRPTAEQWSALEYGCHVRDVFRVFDERLASMLDTEGAQFANWDQDVAAIEGRYDQQDPSVVARDLVDAADAHAARWDAVVDDQWQRVAHRSDGATFTVDSFARYLMHDPVHHLTDVARGNGLLRGS